MSIHAVSPIAPSHCGIDIQRRRKALGWTTTQLARRLQISPDNLRDLEVRDDARSEIWYRVDRVLLTAEQAALSAAAGIMKWRGR